MDPRNTNPNSQNNANFGGARRMNVVIGGMQNLGINSAHPRPIPPFQIQVGGPRGVPGAAAGSVGAPPTANVPRPPLPGHGVNTEICVLNRNPADFTIPEEGNIYMYNINRQVGRSKLWSCY